VGIFRTLTFLRWSHLTGDQAADQRNVAPDIIWTDSPFRRVDGVGNLGWGDATPGAVIESELQSFLSC